MALFAMSDLHLAKSIDKPMDIFGNRWQDYMERIEENWTRLVGEEDTVIINGDVSWATYLAECEADFSFLHSLPGKKILMKGNHDYWWESITKMRGYVAEKGFGSIELLHNNAYVCGDVAIAGNRGWNDPSIEGFGAEDRKIFDRELIRAELSLEEAAKSGASTLVFATHYPPITRLKQVNEAYAKLFDKYGVRVCLYGHLHAAGFSNALEGDFNGVIYKLVSADYLQFSPYRITF
ncbi:MAG: serine/threonine protein phosphatase [Ruminococcaceae bacterium]|nr:serine/threonine protein phosphatase [Oscillospiraceae bacterium]